jgi:predicted ATPase/DNA-binding SARP family transcriptional activator
VAPHRVEFRVLGPLQVVVDGEIVEIGSRKQRMLLCALAAEPGRAVPADALVEVLWAGVPPVSADVTLRGLVSRLRRALGGAGDRLVAGQGGYLLRLAADEVDADRFVRLVTRGRDDLAIGRPDQAAVALRTALDLWRGTPMVELADSELGRVLAARLAEARAAAIEELAGAELAAGRPAAAVDLLGPHLAANPLREPAWEHLILALYRLGRQADALNAYRRVRGILRDDLGVEPNPALRRLQNRILVQDHGLDLVHPARTPRLGGRGLPSALNPLVGRDEDLAALRAALADTRLLTLTGVGGVGKTRLALQLAVDQLDLWDVVQLVELAPLEPGGRVDVEIARRLGVAGHGEALRHLADYLSSRRVLMVLDNCEHLLDEVARVAESLLRSCVGLTVLATSREPLGVGGEVLWPVQPLSLPPAGSSAPQELTGSSAVTLFCQRAQGAQMGFGLTPENAEDVQKICRRLDGIPLALELAAARLRVLATHQIAARLDDRFALLTAGSRTALPRHQTLRATMDWSYQLLAPDDQAGLRALTVFPSDFDLTAATAVIGIDRVSGTAEDVLFRLIDKSLVQVRQHEGEARYRMLETVQAYGAERLAEAGEQVATRRRHREHYCRLAAGWQASRFVTATWSRRVAADEDNLRAAVANALADGDGDAARQLLSGLWPYWAWTGRPEAVELLERALALDGTDVIARAEVSMGLGLLLVSWELGPRERGAELIDSAMALAEEADDDGCRSWAHFFRGELLSFGGDRAAARSEYLTGLRLIQQPARAAAFHHALGWVALAEPDLATARTEFETAIAYGAEGDVHVAHAQAALALILAMAGEHGWAATAAGDAVAAARRFPLPGVLVMALVRAAQTLLICGDDALAGDALREVFTLLHRLGTRPFRSEALEATAVLAHRIGDEPFAIECLAAAAACRVAPAAADGLDVLGPDLSGVRATALTTLGAQTIAEITRAATRTPRTEAIAATRAWLDALVSPGVGVVALTRPSAAPPRPRHP